MCTRIRDELIYMTAERVIAILEAREAYRRVIWSLRIEDSCFLIGRDVPDRVPLEESLCCVA